jgi:hypothetical protein
MAIYVYKTNNGALQSWIPNNLTIAQAQAQGLLADNATLAANRMAAVDGLPPLDETHVWDATQKTVVVVAAPVPAPIMAVDAFILLFTDAEYQGVQHASTLNDPAYNNRIAKFNGFLQTATSINLSDPFVVGVVGTSMVNQGILTQAEADRILSGQGF